MILESLTLAAVHPTRLRLSESALATPPPRAGKSKSGVTARFLGVTVLPQELSPCEARETAPSHFSVLLKLTLWGCKLVMVRLELPSACCGEELVADLRHEVHFCPTCSSRYKLPCGEGATAWTWDGLALRHGFRGDLSETSAALDTWLALRSTDHPLERVLSASQLLDDLLKAAWAFEAVLPPPPLPAADLMPALQGAMNSALSPEDAPWSS